MLMRLWKSGVLFALALGACQAKGGSGAGSAAPAPQTVAAGAAGCRAFQAGKDNVIRTFCDGPGSAAFTVGSASGKFGGGACESTGQMFSFNAGVVVTPGAGAPKPDYVGLSVTNMGEFKGGILSLVYAGKRWGSTEIHGNATATGGTFEGPVHVAGSQEQAVVKGNFTC
jgi:hypothetical protein